MSLIEFEIQRQDIDAWLAEESQLSLLGVLKHQRLDLRFIESTLPSNARNLKCRRRRRNVRIQARARCRSQVGRNRHARIIGAKRLHAASDAIDQSFIRRTEI